MGTGGTFNLAEFFRQMGIQNPEPQLREFVQPVVTVGDFGDLTPRHEPPTALFGGDISAVVAEFSIVQIASKAPGGCVLKYVVAGLGEAAWGLGTRTAGLLDASLAGTFSLEPVVSTVERGTSPVSPLPFAVSNLPILGTASRTLLMGLQRGLFLPPGSFFSFHPVAQNASMNNWAVIIQDVPASQNAP